MQNYYVTSMLPCYVVILACFVRGVWGYSGGAPDFTCRDPSVFHTRKLNSTYEGIIMPRGADSNPYRLETEARTFTPGQKVTVTLYSRDPSKTLKGFFIQAIQANVAMRDLRRRAFGTFINTTSGERPSVCQKWGTDMVGGITHTSNTPRRTVRVLWIAPEDSNPGPVQFVATGVQDYNTYWTDIRSPMTLQPRNYTISKDDTAVSRRWTPTAAWYHWLQYLNSLNLRASNPALADVQAQDGTNSRVPNVLETANHGNAGTRGQKGSNNQALNTTRASNDGSAGTRSISDNTGRTLKTQPAGQQTENKNIVQVENSQS